MREELTATDNGLRAALRRHTAGVHQDLDDRVGSFSTNAQYKAFVVRSLRFRQVAEPAVAGLHSWHVPPLCGALQADLADLGVRPEPAPTPILFQSDAEKAGALYVLEGSALGAKLLLRRAEALGFNGSFGARHLVEQTSQPQRWKAFLHFLDTATFDRQLALNAAHTLFERALALYSEDLHEYV